MSRENEGVSGNTRRRRMAEQRLKDRTPSAAGALSEPELRRLHHELEVHQVELEMQNEELQQAREEAEGLLRRYADLYDFAPVAYLTLDRAGEILQANLAGAALLGVERSRLAGRSFASFLPARSRPEFARYLEAALAGTVRQILEVPLELEGAPARFVRIEAAAVGDAQRCRVAVSDVTERHRAELEQQRLIGELNDALRTVRRLTGLLPICAGCKDIRDEQGRWVQLEVFIRDRSEAEFSHGLCPKCTKEWEGKP